MGSQPSHRVWLFRSPITVRDALVLLLAFTAGCVDAISYLGLGNVFTANMTGNTVLLGLALAQKEGYVGLRLLAALVGYLVGVAGGALLMGRTGKKTIWPPTATTIFTLELLILTALTLGAALFPPPFTGAAINAMILFAAAAMGMQTVGATALGIRGVTTTYLTGTWTGMISGLVHFLPLAQNERVDAPVIGIQAAVVSIYLLAAVVGGLAVTRWHLLAFVVPTVAMAAVVTAAWWEFRRLDA